MSKQLFNRTLPILIALFLMVSAVSYGQEPDRKNSDFNTTDSLSLNKIIDQIVKTHPSVKQAQEVVSTVEAKIALVKSATMPTISGNSEYTRIGPTPSMTIPGLGTFQFAPGGNFTLGVNYEQTIWDFGKTKKDEALEAENKNLFKEQIDQIKQKIALLASNSFFSLIYLQEAIKIKDEQIQTLKEHLDFVEKKKQTGAATDYEILSTQVRISNAENQEYDLESMRNVQLSVLNELLGLPAETPLRVNDDLNTRINVRSAAELIDSALKQRDEMKIIEEKGILTQLKYESVNNQNNATFNTFASAGAKNGYIPNLNTVKLNYAAGVSLHIPLYDGGRLKNNLRLANSSIVMNNLEKENTRRNISSEVIEKQTNLLTAEKKMSHYELQLNQAQRALSLAQVSYKAGALTNLDLLDATTTVSDSRLQLLKSKVDYAIGIYNLKAAIGVKLYNKE